MMTDLYQLPPAVLAAAAAATENNPGFAVAWFDFVMVLTVLLGIRTGKKRGMSEELLDVVEWLVIVGGCALGYQPLGKFLAAQTQLSLFLSYLLAYVTLIIAVFLAFSGIKRLVGNKLVESDYFGRCEYTGGMLAGAVRFLCMVMVVLALMNARYYTAEQRAAIRQAAIADTGIPLVPTLSGFQVDIFVESATGKFVKANLPFLLITPTAYDFKSLGATGPGKKTDKILDEVSSPTKKEAPKPAPKKE